MKRNLSVVLGFLLASSAAWATACPAGYASWSQVTILSQSSLAGNVTGYPFLFPGNAENATVAHGGHGQLTTGVDTIFCTGNNSGTLINYAPVIGYNQTTGAGAWYVLVPTVSTSTNQNIYMGVGNASATDQSNAAGTFAAFLQAHLFGTSGSLVLTDSTGNCGSPVNHGATAAAGPVSVLGAANFTAASTQWIDTGCTSNAVSNKISILMWIDYTSGQACQRIVSNLSNAPYNGYEMYIGTSCGTNGTNEFQTGAGTGSLSLLNGFHGLSAGTWSYIAGVQDGTSAGGYRVYYNGALEPGSATASQGISASASNVNIGRWPGGASQYLDGKVAELLIYNGVISADYIKANYIAENTPASFWAVTTFSSASGAIPAVY